MYRFFFVEFFEWCTCCLMLLPLSRALVYDFAYEYLWRSVRVSMTRLRQRALARLRCTRMSFDGEHANEFLA